MSEAYIKIKNGKITSAKGSISLEELKDSKLNLKRGFIEVHGLSDVRQIRRLLTNIDSLHNVLDSREIYVLAEDYDALIRIYLWLSQRKIVLITRWNILFDGEFLKIISRILRKANVADHVVKIGADSVDTLSYLEKNCLSIDTKELVLSKFNKVFCDNIKQFNSITLFRSNSSNVATINFAEKTIRVYLRNDTFLDLINNYINFFKNIFNELTLICKNDCDKLRATAEKIFTVLSSKLSIKIDTAVINSTRLYFQLNNNSLLIQGDLNTLETTVLETALKHLLENKSVRISLSKNQQIIFGRKND